MRAWVVKLDGEWYKRPTVYGPTIKAVTTEKLDEAWAFGTMKEAAEFVVRNEEYIDARRIELVLIEAANLLEVDKHYDKENTPTGVNIQGEVK